MEEELGVKMKCRICGSKIPRGWSFCPTCQTPIQSNDAVAKPSEVVSSETIEKWRKWGVPEEVIRSEVEWREMLTVLRREEEWISVEGFAYMMPRLPDVERRAWGFAKAIDFEGTIGELRVMRDKLRRIDRWTYRHEYQAPYVEISGTRYPLIREMAEMLLLATTPDYRTVTSIVKGKIIRRRRVVYVVRPLGSRAVRVCYLTKPFLVLPHKKQRANLILKKYRESPTIPLR